MSGSSVVVVGDDNGGVVLDGRGVDRDSVSVGVTSRSVVEEGTGNPGKGKLGNVGRGKSIIGLHVRN